MYVEYDENVIFQYKADYFTIFSLKIESLDCLFNLNIPPKVIFIPILYFS